MSFDSGMVTTPPILTAGGGRPTACRGRRVQSTPIAHPFDHAFKETSMTRWKTAAPLALLLLSPAAFALAAPMPAPSAAPTAGYRAELLRGLDDVGKKVVDLAEAMPADKYAWRPAEGVRSVGEVYVHIAQANFGLPRIWGAAPATAGIDVKGLAAQANDKAKVVEALKQSLASVRQAVLATPDSDLDRKVHIFDHDGTVRETMAILGNHLHEHLGQSIAYARMNGVVPPWTAAEMAAEKKK
jgi:uncharacterized damage-inducible protein DinB